MPFYSPSQLGVRRKKSPSDRLAQQDAANQRALEKLAQEGLLGDFSEYREPSAWDRVKRAGSGALDVLQRGEFATAGAADVLASGGSGAEALGAAGKELFSGVGDIKGEKKTIGDVVRKYNPGYEQFSEEHPFLSMAPDLAMSIAGDPTTYIGGFLLRGAGALVKNTGKAGVATAKWAAPKTSAKIGEVIEGVGEVIGKTFDPAYGFKKAGTPQAYDALMQEKQFSDYLRGKYAKELQPVTKWLRNKNTSAEQIDEFMRVAKGDLDISAASKEVQRLAELHKGVFNKMGRRDFRYSGKDLAGLKEDYLPNRPAAYNDLLEKTGGKVSSGQGRPLNITRKSFEKEQVLKTTDDLQNFWREKGLPEDQWGEALARSIDVRMAESSSKIRAIRTHSRWTNELPDVFRKLPAGTKTPWAEGVLPGESIWMPRGNLLMFPQEIIAKSKVVRDAIENGTDLSHDALMELERTMVGVSSRVPAYAVPTEVVESINRLNQAMGNPEDIGKYWDKALNVWKNTAILSPGFHTRNFISSTFQNYLAGGLPVIKKYGDASRVLWQKSDTGEIMGKSIKTWRKWAEMYGITSGSLVGQSVGKTGTGAAEAVFQANRSIGSGVEQINRLALFMHGIEKGMKPADASALVRKFHFDYDELTNIEKKVFRRVMPFYTWQRKNIPLMLEQLFKQPGKFENIAKLKRAVAGVPESENNPEWWKSEDVWSIRGTDVAYNAGLPYADLNTVPLVGRETLGSMGPAKTAIDLWSNRDSLLDKPIKSFPGETVPLVNAIPVKVPPGLKYAIEGFLPVAKRYGFDLANEITNIVTGKDEDSAAALSLLRKTTGIAILRQTKTKQERERIYRLMRELQNYRNYRSQEEGANGR